MASESKKRKLEMSDYYKEQFMSFEFSDITIKIHNELIPGHKIVLARNKVFKNMFASSKSESSRSVLKITDCDAETFKTYLKYLYTDEVNNNEKTINLLALADQYLDLQLKTICELELSKDINLKNAMEKLTVAAKYHCDLLKVRTSKFIVEHYEELRRSPNFKSIYLDENTVFLIMDLFNQTVNGIFTFFII